MDEYATTSHNSIGDQFMENPHHPNKRRMSEGSNVAKQRVFYVPTNSSHTSGAMPSHSMSAYGSYPNNLVERPKSNFHQMSNAPVNVKSQSHAMAVCTSDPKTNKEAAKAKTSKKKLQKEIRQLDDSNHYQCVELSCGLCSIIVPDEDTMIRHSYSHMHLMNLTKCWREGTENVKEVMKNANGYDSDSSSSECSDEVAPRKQRVQWNLTDEVAMDTDYVNLKRNRDGNSLFNFLQ